MDAAIEPAPGERAGRGPSPLLWLVVLGAAGLVGLEVLQKDLSRAGFGVIDPSRTRITGVDAYDPRWLEWLAVRLAEHDPVEAGDPESVRELARRVGEMPFVAEVGEPHVLWPDGLALAIRLHEPVACVRRGRAFLVVAADGTILPGTWGAPPIGERSFLPVIGPVDEAFAAYRPGDFLVEPRHLDALAVAVSMTAHLDARDIEDLGPVVIDATTAASASVEEPGVRLLLEDRRLVLFGRSPRADAPGELPAEHKWQALACALDAWRRGLEGGDWRLVDVRWDRPGLVLFEREP